MKRGKFRLALAALSGLLGCAIAGITYWSNTAMATPGFQFNSETLSRSVFEDIDVKSNVPYTH